MTHVVYILSLLGYLGVNTDFKFHILSYKMPFVGKLYFVLVSVSQDRVNKGIDVHVTCVYDLLS